MRLWILRGVATLIALTALIGCGQQASRAPTQGEAPTPTLPPPTATTESHDGAIVDQASLLAHLRSLGLTVEEAGPVEQPFFREPGTTWRVSGGNLPQPVEFQAYGYDDPELAAGDASQIGPDGNPRTMMISWLEPPHFFRKEAVIVLYLGSDPAAIQLLTDTLDPQFAGR